MIQCIFSAHADFKVAELAHALANQNVHFHAQAIGVCAVKDDNLILRGQVGNAAESLRGYIFKID